MNPSTDSRYIHRTFVRQYSENYCGLACFASIVRYYGGNVKQENLARESGTTLLGTSMLGLYQIALKFGMEVKGYEADAANLKELDSPVILHTLMEGRLEHFVVCYGFFGGKFLIGDPGTGISIILPNNRANGLVKNSFNFNTRYDKTNTTQILA